MPFFICLLSDRLFVDTHCVAGHLHGPQQTDCKSRWVAADRGTLPPSSSGHLIWSKGTLERGERGGKSLLGCKEQPWRPAGPVSAEPLLASRSLSLPRQADYPFPKSGRSAIIDLASGPYPSGAKATAQFTSSSDFSLLSLKENPASD